MSDLIAKILPEEDEPKAFVLFVMSVAAVICCALMCHTFYEASNFSAAAKAGLVQKARQVESNVYWTKPDSHNESSGQ